VRPEDSQKILHPPEHSRKIFCWSLTGHVVLIFSPMLIMAVADMLTPKAEDLSVNLVDDPSTGPVVAQETQRLPPSPKPDDNVNPPPVPPVPPPPEPQIPDVMPTPPPPEPMLADLPMPMPREKKLPEAPPEPALQLPKYVKKKTAPPPDPDRTLKDTRKIGQRTGSQTNPDIAIGKRDTAQRYGEKFSNTPNGGDRSNTRYAALLGAFLKIRWSAMTPPRALLGDAKPEVTVYLHISGDGRLIEARIERPSGNSAMDSAVQRLLESLKTQQLPRSPDGESWQNRVIFDTSG